MIQRQHIQVIIDVFGWLYFIIWSISFYPQVFVLLKSKSAMGMNSNYVFINLTGYAMYTVYNVYGYMKGNNSETGNVDKSDILFSIHSVFVYSVTISLFFYYPHKIQVSPYNKIYLLIQWLVFIYFGIQAFDSKKPMKLQFFGHKTNLGYFQTLGYFKMFSTLLKHPPQIYFIFKRKSTKGWSIQGMIMDFMGGFFSLIALLLELYLNPKSHINKAKLFLSVMSMIYDVTYMIQHFALYGDKQIDLQKQSQQRKIQSIKPEAEQQQQKLRIVQKSQKKSTQSYKSSSQ